MKSSVRDGPAGVAAVAEQNLPVGALIVNSLMSWKKEKEQWDRSLKGWTDLQGDLQRQGEYVLTTRMASGRERSMAKELSPAQEPPGSGYFECNEVT